MNKRRIKLKLLFVIVISFLFTVVSFGGQAQLTVEAINATPDGNSIVGDEVIVEIFHHNTLLENLHGKVGPENKAVFSNIQIEEHIAVIAKVKHQNMMFSGPAVQLQPTESEISTAVNVFDVSFDKSYLSVPTHHIIIKTNSKALQITEYIQLKNSSGKAITSKEDSQHQTLVLEVGLPDGFKNLKFKSYFEESAIIVTDQGFYDTMAIPPGEFHAGFSYTIDIDSKIIDILKRITLPTSTIMVFAELGQAKLQGLGQPINRATSANGASVNYYKISDISANDQIKFQLIGFNVSKFSLNEWIIPVTVFGGVLIVAFMRLRRKN